MTFELDKMTLLLGMMIFFARMSDVALGTLRTISIVQGRKWMAFGLGFFEVTIWLIVISTVIHKIDEYPVLGIFYALGFASGNIVGIKVENWLAMGSTILRIISRKHFKTIAQNIREQGFSVTVFHGEGKDGPVAELYIVCRRRDLNVLLRFIHQIEPTAFYVTEQVGAVSKIYRPFMQPATGWRAILKKK
ncbi:MAG: DUF2179 domain-containing protein [Candidatus Electrothrix sp. LOE2]|nr:DUF2179 domain-containing protein [Candidatus Electrothrix sp. LOE2]